MMILGSTLVIIGVVLKNTSEQVKMSETKKRILSIGGIVSFLVGWFIVGYCLSQKFPTMKYQIWGAVSFIVIAVMGLKMIKEIPKPILGTMFIIGWLGLGYIISSKHEGPMRWSGMAVPALVLVSMMGVLPWQRKVGNVDGFGFPMFVYAWFGMSLLVANKL